MAHPVRREPGEIAAILDLYDRYPDELEADLRHRYGVRLRDLFRGEYTFREIHVYVSKLPQDSLTQTALRDDPDRQTSDGQRSDRFGPWSLEHYLLANVIDAVRENTYVHRVINRKPNTEPQPPEPTPRPGALAEQVRTLTPRDYAKAALLNQLRATG